MPKVLLFLAVLSITYLLFAVSLSLETERNDVDISVFDSQVKPTSFSIAVLGDVHLREGCDYLTVFRSLLLEIEVPFCEVGVGRAVGCCWAGNASGVGWKETLEK